MKKKIRSIAILALFNLAILSSCSKSSSSPNNSGGGGGTGTPVTVPNNIQDFKASSNAGITLNPYPSFPPVASLIPVLGVGYYYISLGGADTLTIVIAADSNGGGNASVFGQTSDSGPNFFSSGDSLQYLVKLVKYIGQIDTVSGNFTLDLQSGYTLTNTDTVSFSDSYSGAIVYTSTLGSNTNYNLFNIESYVAFRLTNSMGSRYGWILMSSDPAQGALLTVYEIAFNRNYNQPIAIGKYQ